MTKWIATLGIGAALAFATPDTAEAQPFIQGGLVNVNIGNVTFLNDVNVAVALQAVVGICGTQLVVPVGILAAQLVRTGQATACTLTGSGAPVTIGQD